MKWAIACIKDNKCIGYWTEGKIRTKTIETYGDKKELKREFENAGRQIITYYDEDIIPIVMIISADNSADKIRGFAHLHLENVKSNWPHLPERIAKIEQVIKNIKVLK